MADPKPTLVRGTLLAERALAELVYDHVRGAVDLCHLIVMEEDLIEGFRRALADAGERIEDAERQVAAYVEAAWERVSAEVMEQLMEPALMAALPRISGRR